MSLVSQKMKVAVERRRRDRINRALESLRHLLAEDLHSDVVSREVHQVSTICVINPILSSTVRN